MKGSILKYGGIAFFIFAILIQGCGYTTRSLLPSNYKAIRVDNFTNSINIPAEQSNVRMYRGYRPGMEIDITKAVINRFLNDGNLKIASETTADLILKGELTDFKQDALRYDANDIVEEYRIKLIVNLQLIDTKTGNLVWQEKGFAGESTYRTSGSLTTTEDAAMKVAIEDLARRIVERTVEAW